MKLFSFLFHHKSNSFLSICALLLFLSSPITLYAAEENTVVIEESPATHDITVEVSEEINNDTSQTEFPAVDSTQETITIETPSVDTPENLLPAQDTALPDTQDSIVNDLQLNLLMAPTMSFRPVDLMSEKVLPRIMISLEACRMERKFL